MWPAQTKRLPPINVTRWSRRGGTLLRMDSKDLFGAALASEVVSLGSVLFARRNGLKAVACLPLEAANAFVVEIERAADVEVAVRLASHNSVERTKDALAFLQERRRFVFQAEGVAPVRSFAEHCALRLDYELLAREHCQKCYRSYYYGHQWQPRIGGAGVM